jgi:hypothetical protein
MNVSPLDPIGPGVFRFTCLDVTEADEIVREVSQLSVWEAGPVGRGKGTARVVLDDVRLAWEIRESAAPNAFNKFERRVRDRLRVVARALDAGPLDLSDLRLVRYDEGGFFKVHSDTTGDDRRRFAVVVYLNDDFGGGATVFPLLGCRSVPEKGKGVVFPAERLHRGDVVKEGTKYILVTWLLHPQQDLAHGTALEPREG